MSDQGPGRIYDVLARQRAELLRAERAAASELVRAYGGIWYRIQGRLDELFAAREAALAAGEVVDMAWLFSAGRLENLQRQIEQELRLWAQYAEPRIVNLRGRAIEAAVSDAEELTRVAAGPPPPGYELSFTHLPTQAFEDIVGLTGSGSPLRELLDRLGPQASESVKDALLEGIATGQNPRAIAGKVREAFGGNLSRALTVSRTETLRAYREAQRREYEANSDIVDKWVWISALSGRTCASCFANHGSLHPLTEIMSEHPNGRCVQSPSPKSWAELGFDVPDDKPLDYGDGETRFRELTETQQRNILGHAGYEAYQAGAFKLSDLVGTRYSPDWGKTSYVKSLSSVLGADEAARWRAVAQENLRKVHSVVSFDKVDEFAFLGELEPTIQRSTHSQPDAYVNRIFAPSSEQRRKAEDAALSDIKRVAHKLGVSPQEIEQTCLTRMKEAARVPVSVRSGFDGAEGIARDGKFKSIFETNTSKGIADKGFRATSEEKGLGIPLNANPQNRPIYGYSVVEGTSVESYGAFEFELRDEVRSRTTMVVGDSLYRFDRSLAVGTPLTSPGIEGLGASAEQVFAGNVSSFSYYELQIQGGVSLSDIKRLIIHRVENIEETRSIAEMFRKLGIEVIYDNSY